MDIASCISEDLQISSTLISEALSRARLSVKRFEIPKRNGGRRVILQPSKKLKTIQYWLMLNVFNKMEVHQAALAYKKGFSILTNAEMHRNC